MPLPTVPDGDGAGRLRVAHLLVSGQVDGIGMHVLELARAQLLEGSVQPLLFSAPTEPYARRLVGAGVPVVGGRGGTYPGAFVDYTRLDLERHGVDLVHLHGYRAVLLVSVLRRLRATSWGRLPAVATCHGWVERPLRRRIRNRLERYSYRWLHQLIACSTEQVERLAAARPALPVAYVPNGVRLESLQRSSPTGRSALRARYGLPPDAEVVAAIGRLSPEKRLDVFVDAAQRILRERPGVHFLVVGEGRERPRLEALVRRRGLTGQVHFTGMVEDVPAVCAGITVLLHASDAEGTPRAVLEAMAAGVPVVATAVGGVPEMIQHRVHGLLVSSGDPAALARQALWLLATPRAREELGDRARARVAAEFTICSMRQRVEDVYRAALSHPAATRTGSRV
jgi:glycosyltransferase involved in cell wall biosynthesis